jgi:hypothetical protein
MKSPRIMGREARNRKTPRRFNPFDPETEIKQFLDWTDGWVAEDLKFWLDSGIEMEEYNRKNSNLYKD